MSNFNLETLKGLEGDKVTISVANANVPHEATIKEVRESAMNGEQWEAFAVLLNVPKHSGSTLEQGMYQVSHETFGDIEVFASPNSDTELEIVVTRANEKAN